MLRHTAALSALKSTARLGPASLARLASTKTQVPELPEFLPDLHDFSDYKVPKDYVFPQKRDPYAKYDDQQNRRNFNEPLHPFQDNIDAWSPDHIDFTDDKTALKHFLYFAAAVGSFPLIIWALDLWPDRPNMPRSYPHGGLYRDLGGKEGEEALFQARVDKGN